MTLKEAVAQQRHIDILCIGSPKIYGDAIGPMVGTILERRKINANIIGTLKEPVVRSTYRDRLKLLRDGSFIVVVDAGISDNCPGIKIYNGPTYPGAALHTGIDPIGNMSIVCYTGKSIAELLKYCPKAVRTTANDVATSLITIIGYI